MRVQIAHAPTGAQGSRGAVLVQFALLAFGLFALASLVVDLGLARVAQGAMQSASDSAALEGVRLRDELQADPVGSDQVRRAAASSLVARVFDEDLELASENVDVLLGAGPVFSAPTSGLIEIEASPTYQPVPELNLANEQHGDLVAGEYLPTADHAESGDYARADFTPAVGGGAAAASGSFLVRLRRGHDPLGLDMQPGVSSSGPGVPLLFGLGSLVQASDSYDPRSDGLTVRATSVASALPAMRVGEAGAGWLGLAAPGVAASGDPLFLAFELSSWIACWPASTPCAGTPLELEIGQPDGELRARGGACDGQLVGRLLPGARRVGALISGVQTTASLTRLPAGAHYVSVYSQLETGLLGVVGFGSIEVQSSQLDSVGMQLAALKLCSLVAPQNASSRSVDAAAALASVTGLRAAQEEYATFGEPLLAPALVR